MQIRMCLALVASDILLAALHDVRPVEKAPGLADDIYARYFAELKQVMRDVTPGGLMGALGQLSNGMFGVRGVLKRAAAHFFDEDHVRQVVCH